MKTKVTFNIVTPSKAEDKKIKKILSEAEKNKDTFDLSKAKHPDGKAIKKKTKKAS
ncbi:hypothetical protein [Leptospira levettii]|uniref:hypothetical protein n=1 Tax=Leptospira levettii TaxID=2023178 RepID=UPI0013FDC145|nr:hypothetical protein [Leptospira levettii]